MKINQNRKKKTENQLKKRCYSNKRTLKYQKIKWRKKFKIVNETRRKIPYLEIIKI